MFKGSWKTTAAAIVAAASMGVVNAPEFDGTLIDQIAQWVNYAAIAAMGFFARDNNVSSKAAGAE